VRFIAGSAPPERAAMMIARESLLHALPRRASVTALARLIRAQ